MPAKAKPIPDGVPPHHATISSSRRAENHRFMPKKPSGRIHHEPDQTADGTIMHATLRIGRPPMVMISDSSEPPSDGRVICISTFRTRSLLSAGAEAAPLGREPATSFLATAAPVSTTAREHLVLRNTREDVAPAEMKKRDEAFFSKSKGGKAGRTIQ